VWLVLSFVCSVSLERTFVVCRTSDESVTKCVCVLFLQFRCWINTCGFHSYVTRLRQVRCSSVKSLLCPFQGYAYSMCVCVCIRGPFEKFLDPPYYSESELCGGAVTVSFSKYLPWQVMHFFQRSAHFSKTCCRPLIT
jgi:hypothetical protein